jgi:hypothetical protein
VTDAQGRLFTTWKVTTNSSANWVPWWAFLGEVGNLPAAARNVAVAPLSNRALQPWVTDANGGLWSTWKTSAVAGGGWSGWEDFTRA